MRIGVISDIHGNLTALDAVLADLERARVDRIVCLGDVAATGSQPRQTVERLRALDYPTVLGNADEELVNMRAETPGAETPDMDEDGRRLLDIDRWCAAQFAPADLDYLRAFRPTLTLPLGDGQTLLCMHGSPRSYDDVIVASTPEDDLARMLSGVDAAVVAGGHTHEQLLRRYKGTVILNPGSVGLPFERGPGMDDVRNPPWAEYAIVAEEDGVMSIELRRVPIDVGAVVRAIRDSGIPHAAWLAQDWQRRSGPGAVEARIP